MLVLIFTVSRQFTPAAIYSSPFLINQWPPALILLVFKTQYLFVIPGFLAFGKTKKKNPVKPPADPKL